MLKLVLIFFVLLEKILNLRSRFLLWGSETLLLEYFTKNHPVILLYRKQIITGMIFIVLFICYFASRLEDVI